MTSLSPYQKLLLAGAIVLVLLFTTIAIYAWLDDWHQRRKLKRGRRRR